MNHLTIARFERPFCRFFTGALAHRPEDRWYQKPGAWFWTAFAFSGLIRLYFVLFTQGTSDVSIWQEHATRISQVGLISYYHETLQANHPPLISVVETGLLQVAKQTGIPFRVLLRAPFAGLDVGIAMLLLSLLRERPGRFTAVAWYWLNPLTMIFSSYHGNTDNFVAFSLVLAVWLAAGNKPALAGVALGVGLWV